MHPGGPRPGPRSGSHRPRRSRPRRSRGARPSRLPSPSLLPSTTTCRENCGPTTPTHTRSQRNRVSRRGGHRKARAQRPINEKRPAHDAISRRPRFQSPDPKPGPGRRRRRAVSSPDKTVRNAVASAAAGRKTSGEKVTKKAWFKREDRGERLAGIVFSHRRAMGGSDLANGLISVKKFAYAD